MGAITTGEMLEHFQERLSSFLKSVCIGYHGKAVLFACHVGVIKAFQGIMGHASPLDINRQKGLGNAAALSMDVKSSDVE